MTAPTFIEMDRFVRRHRCGWHPDLLLSVGMRQEDGAYYPSCTGCIQEGRNPMIEPRSGIVKERMASMLQHSLPTQLSPGRVPDPAALTPAQRQELKKFINDKLSDFELDTFLYVVGAFGLDFWRGEVYSVSYFSEKKQEYEAAIILSIQFFRSRAQAHSAYLGHQAGIVVKDKEGKLQERPGTMKWPGDELYGGWCTAYRKGNVEPTRWPVELARWKKDTKFWRETPENQIAKVAEKQCLEHVFSEAFHLANPAAMTMPMIVDAEAMEDSRPAAIQPTALIPPVERQAHAAAAQASEPTPANSPTSPRQGSVPCPVHSGAFLQKRTGANNSTFWSHRQGDEWCNESSEDVQAAWAAEISRLAGELGLDTREKRDAWVSAHVEAALRPEKSHSWHANHYHATIETMKGSLIK